MNWIEQAVAQFCQDLGCSIPGAPSELIQLDLPSGECLQLERHSEKLTLWLAIDVPWHQSQQVLVTAMQRCCAEVAPAMPVRCGWLNDRLLLFVTLPERRVTVPSLHQALNTLTNVRAEACQL